MKFLETPELAFMNRHFESGDCRVYCRVEQYSCKKVPSEKALAKDLEDAAVGQADSSLGKVAGSPFGPLSLSSSRKVFVNLIQTLNLCFPDYDFSSIKPEQFVRENNLNLVMNFINTTLSAAIETYASDIVFPLWRTIEEEIRMSDSEIFSLNLDPDADPVNEEGTVWSFDYFFYNRRQRKILVFACKSVRMDCDVDLTADEEELEEEEEVFTMEDASPFHGPQSYDQLKDRFIM